MSAGFWTTCWAVWKLPDGCEKGIFANDFLAVCDAHQTAGYSALALARAAKRKLRCPRCGEDAGTLEWLVDLAELRAWAETKIENLNGTLQHEEDSRD